MAKISVRESVVISRPLEVVFDFTQDWSRRTRWDPSIVASEPVAGAERAYRVRARGRLRFLARYKLFDRPNRTSLGMFEFSSRMVTSGGGSWEYAVEPSGTRFTQINTLVLAGWLGPVAWLVRRELGRQTRISLENAKRLLESGAS